MTNSQMDTVIRGGTAVTGGGTMVADIGILDGKIAAIAPYLDVNAAQELDASDHLVLPGGVDTHCHIEQISGAGLMNADTFETATRSAAFGGTTTVVSFAAQHPGQRIRKVVEDDHNGVTPMGEPEEAEVDETRGMSLEEFEDAEIETLCANDLSDRQGEYIPTIDSVTEAPE